MAFPFVTRARDVWSAARGVPAVVAKAQQPQLMSPVGDRGGWFPLVKEALGGNWQRNITVDYTSLLSYHAVFACVTLIAGELKKMAPYLAEQDKDGIWSPTENSAYTVLRKPNGYQNKYQFWESWLLSKLLRGNTYVLKVRDGSGIVRQLYVLDPNRVRPLISPSGAVYYELQTDVLSGVMQAPDQGFVRVPAREIIHDRWNTFFHPLIGLSPIFASSMPAAQGLAIQKNSALFFMNNSTPHGILTAPGDIGDDDGEEMKAGWEQNFGGENIGRVAVLGNGLKFEQLAMTAVDAQLIDQLKYSVVTICSAFHVPAYKINVGEMPKYDNMQALDVQFYKQCIQVLVLDAQACMDEGLEIGPGIGPLPFVRTMFDVEQTLAADAKSQMEYLKEAVEGSIMAPNEARKKINLARVPGGDSPMAQQQDFSLEALAKRDAGPAPMPPSLPPPTTQPSAAANPGGKDVRSRQQQRLVARIGKHAERIQREPGLAAA